MAVRGRKPTPTVLRLITGAARKHPRRARVPDPLPAGSIERPARLHGNVAKLWEKYIARAFWLTWADGPKALMWVYLQAEFEKSPTKMLSARIAQLRALGSELGFDQASRERLQIPSLPTVPPSPKTTDPAGKYF